MLPDDQRRVLIAPFLKEVFHHGPQAASLAGIANVVLVVRNSLLGQAHHEGLLTSGIISVTEQAVGSLSHLIAARDRHPVENRRRSPVREPHITVAGHPQPVRLSRSWAKGRAQ